MANREEWYCRLTGCSFLEWFGGHLRKETKQPMYSVYSAAQLVWFWTHNNKLYFWLVNTS